VADVCTKQRVRPESQHFSFPCANERSELGLLRANRSIATVGCRVRNDRFRVPGDGYRAIAMATERNSANQAVLAGHPMDSKRTAAWRGKGRDGAGDPGPGRGKGCARLGGGSFVRDGLIRG